MWLVGLFSKNIKRNKSITASKSFCSCWGFLFLYRAELLLHTRHTHGFKARERERARLISCLDWKVYVHAEAGGGG
ncbi:Uncharacterized protein APZ42_027811 [Daphnia magna]|uniref:Uncharacterized protein n=1 Tax=Daphnia magna TaxID=35525 RepID=A0A164R1Y6_9CRUS|nr:Uncharacterized protein APZ42_027811 [Daphnia magna]